ncbi:SGNH hydrolase-type esterase domain-containing protein [Aspergillus cavernicola]|uniref:SGNH hydrolase-type esterase domain-containing protein n=1 Tax=Aspergillus cavernicola TaxID=176166 RepID=A0ABR4HZN0_9EURO
MALYSFICFLMLLSALLFQTAIALGTVIPTDLFPDHQSNDPTINKVPLRILALGASVTWGIHSSTGNGYRKFLREQLVSQGWEVNMVGSKRNGDMKDNQLEAHSGDTIDMVKAAAASSLTYKPNIVLINAGTNDCRRNIDIPNAGVRMRSLIETLISAEDMDNTLIVLSTLLPSGNRAISSRTPNVNNQYRRLVRTMRREGVSIVLADMDLDGGSGRITYPEDYIANGVTDSTHPSDKGYEKMAAIWDGSIVDASHQGLLVRPAGVEASRGGGNCENSQSGRGGRKGSC